MNHRELKRLTDLDGAAETTKRVTEALREHELKPEDFSIRELAEAVIPDGREYVNACDRPAALKAAVELYEGAKVNLNHGEKVTSPRSYADRLGVVRNVQFTADEGLFGDLHFNPKHAVAEQLAWDAEHNPAAVGLSPHSKRTAALRGRRVS